MNKYQEALDNIGSLYMYDEDGEDDCLLSESFMKDDYDILKELVEKETSKKVIRIHTSFDEFSFECPNCHEKTYTNRIRNYCGDCGQRLLWE